MKPGAMALARVQQADGRLKVRPVLILQEMPPYHDLLVCAVSSQLRHECHGFDDIIQTDDDDFATSGLKVASLVRLGLLATLPRDALLGNLGTISETRLRKLRNRLAARLENESQS